MGQPAARQIGARRIDCPVTLLDVNDFPFLVDHERRPVRHSRIGDENTIRLGHFTLCEIAQQGKGCVGLGRELFLGRGIVGTNSKNL